MRDYGKFRGGSKKEKNNLNHNIQATNVRLIDQEGVMLGIKSKSEALSLAEEVGLDLVAISMKSDPPVCRIMDYGKYCYEEKKKLIMVKKKQKIIELKEVRITPTTDDNDYQIKLNRIRKFLESGKKVKVVMRDIRGRQKVYMDQHIATMKKILEEFNEIAKVERYPTREGKRILCVLDPQIK